jgi:hypothetical protein
VEEHSKLVPQGKAGVPQGMEDSRSQGLKQTQKQTRGREAAMRVVTVRLHRHSNLKQWLATHEAHHSHILGLQSNDGEEAREMQGVITTALMRLHLTA